MSESVLLNTLKIALENTDEPALLEALVTFSIYELVNSIHKKQLSFISIGQYTDSEGNIGEPQPIPHEIWEKVASDLEESFEIAEAMDEAHFTDLH